MKRMFETRLRRKGPAYHLACVRVGTGDAEMAMCCQAKVMTHHYLDMEGVKRFMWRWCVTELRREALVRRLVLN